ncbi:hypothetical protein K8I31_02445, partial [bacterium]|nr:hypothetical protein [bacterium]
MTSSSETQCTVRAVAPLRFKDLPLRSFQETCNSIQRDASGDLIPIQWMEEESGYPPDGMRDLFSHRLVLPTARCLPFVAPHSKSGDRRWRY